MEQLAGRVALVTGAGQGIGQGIALALAGAGAKVALAGRTAEKVEKTAALIEERGGTATAFGCDVTDPEKVAEVVAGTVERFGGLNIVVNNAQDFSFGPIASLDLDGLDAGWRSGALGTLHVMKAAHPHLGGGLVVNVSSSAASSPSPGTGGYAAVKAAIEAISRAAALEWASEGIRVLTLVPFARTPAVAAVLDGNPDLEEQVLSEAPLGRWGDAEQEIGRTVVFAASRDAGFMTGTTLVVDGGSTYLR